MNMHRLKVIVKDFVGFVRYWLPSSVSFRRSQANHFEAFKSYFGPDLIVSNIVDRRHSGHNLSSELAQFFFSPLTSCLVLIHPEY